MLKKRWNFHERMEWELLHAFFVTLSCYSYISFLYARAIKTKQ
jgi:hypothetical protein